MARNDNRLKNGSSLGPYKIIRLIGEGGMGEVYEARDEILDRQVALKVISPELSQAKEIIKRFKTEGQTLARLNHHNVVAVHTLGEDKGTHYIVMEYVDGHSLSDLIKLKGALSVQEALHYFKQLLAGVEALHEHGIIHRDIKPKNIIIRKDNSVKIVDFGIAKVEGQPERELTVAGELLGSIYYIAPEVIDGEAASIQSDIWSLGVNLFEILTGEKPFDDEKWSALVRKITSENLLFASAKAQLIPPYLQDMILQMCEKSPSARYATVGEVIQDLAAFQNEVAPRGLTSAAAVPSIADLTRAVPQPVAAAVPSLQTLNSNSSFHISLRPSANSNTNSSLGRRTSTSSTRGSGGPRRKKKHHFVEWSGLVVILVGFGWLINRTYQKYWTPSEEASKAVVASGQNPESTAAPQAQTQVQAAITPNSPANGQSAWVTDQMALQFTWNGEAPANSFLQVARDLGFREILLEIPQAKSPVTTKALGSGPFEDGTYYWRLVKKSPEKTEALFEVQAFHIITASAPHPLYPVAQIVHGTTDDINFYWQEKANVKSYRFQVSSDPGFRRLISDQLLKETKVNLKVGIEGSYFWRVRAEELPSTSLWSEARPLKVQKQSGLNSDAKPLAQTAIKDSATSVATAPNNRNPAQNKALAKSKAKPLPAPKIAQKLQDFALRFSDDGKNPSEDTVLNPPNLTWAKVPGATGYELQISKNANFSQIQWTQTASTSHSKWTSAQPGKYFWRVRAIDRNDNKGFFSSVNKLNLKAPELKPVTVVKIIKPAEEAKVEHPPVALEIPKKPAARVVAAVPKEINKMAVPKLKLPPNGVSIVSLNGVQSPISFKWGIIDAADSYRIEISTNEQFSQVILSTVVRENQLLLTQPLPLGKLFWRLRAEKSGAKSDWTAPYSFEMTK
jgi:serine/threonine protein kinase